MLTTPHTYICYSKSVTNICCEQDIVWLEDYLCQLQTVSKLAQTFDISLLSKHHPIPPMGFGSHQVLFTKVLGVNAPICVGKALRSCG